MTSAVANYAKIMYEKKISEEDLDETLSIYGQVPELQRALISPVVHLEEKERTIEKLFPQKMHAILKTMCKYGFIGHIEEVINAYKWYKNDKQDVLDVAMRYVTKPNEEQISILRNQLCKKYGKSDINLRMREDKSLIGGFVVRIDDEVFDYSLERQIRKMRERLENAEVK